MLGLPVWVEDEAGPYRTQPYPGSNWQPEGHPVRQAHEYKPNGTAKMFTLFRPKTGELRVKGTQSSANAALHPWLEAELSDILAQLPVVIESLSGVDLKKLLEKFPSAEGKKEKPGKGGGQS